MKRSASPSVIARLLRYTKPYRLQLALAILGAICSVAASLLTPFLTGKAIDSIVGPGNVQMSIVLRYITVLIAVTAIGGIFQWILAAATNSLAFSTSKDLRDAVFAHIQKLPLQYLDRQAHGDMISRLASDVDKISDGLLQGFTQLFSGLMTILGTLAFMFTINPIIAAAVVVLTPLSLFVASFIGKRSHAMFQKQSAMRGKISGYVEESVSGARVIQAFGHEAQTQEEFEQLNSELYQCGFRAQFYSALTNPCTRFVNNVVYAAVGTVGAILVLLRGVMSPGTLTTFLLYANQYTKPFNEITGVVTELQTAIAAAKRVFAVLDAEPESDDSALPALQDCDGTVDLEHVRFSYRPDTQLIRDLNLHVSQGNIVAIVGPTGCGKTTLINLLVRFYDVNDGVVRVSDTPIRDVTRKSLRDCYGMVLQDTWLFSGTIRDNIRYGNPDATEDQIRAAAQQAHAHAFIEQFPDGYDTLLTDNGGNLSQGQRQLLCIARIMLTDPPMLILDEATSSIDTRTELKIQQAFHRMMQGRTCFIVAHRLSTIKEADTILVMRDGNVIEQGTHAQLLALGGFYHTLYNSQFADATLLAKNGTAV